jgi:hypothetical protein
MTTKRNCTVSPDKETPRGSTLIEFGDGSKIRTGGVSWIAAALIGGAGLTGGGGAVWKLDLMGVQARNEAIEHCRQELEAQRVEASENLQVCADSCYRTTEVLQAQIDKLWEDR